MMLKLIFSPQYDATVPGGYGGGGEYELQLGFGWTNGVVLDLLAKYGDRLTVEDLYEEEPAAIGSSAIAAVDQNVFPAVMCVVLAVVSCIG